MTEEMTPERWAQVMEEFHRVREAPPGEQPARLSRLESDDPALAREVRSLLTAEASGPLRDRPDRDRPIADYVGPYRLLRRLGEGGMGVVYLAERQESGFCQRVALKLLRAGFLDPRLADHVEHERRVLARLEHPNIARLIDGGTTPSGQPYLAMELVEGDTLMDHVTRHALPLSARIPLFIRICEAVHHAHQQLVIHRDLKPSNVVVGQDGRPRLLDFGIAKLLDPEIGGSGLTRSTPWITPAYASPEQFRGQPVGTLSDVYSLGVILYELLSDEKPYVLEGLSPAEMEHRLCEVPPAPPSERCRDSRRSRELRGDLDTIALKALAKDPSRRYPSAEQLADDLRRHREGRPVGARPDSVGYRLRKLVQRHRVASGVTGAALLLAVAGLLAVLWQAAIARRERDRAEEARTQAEEVTRNLIGLFETADPGLAPVDTTVAHSLLRQGLAQAEALAGQPLVQASVLDALGMIFVNLQQYDRASDLVDRAWNLRVLHLPPDHPDRAASLSHRGRVARAQARYREAEQHYEAALAIRQRIHGPRHPDVADSYRDLAFLMPYLSRDAESLQLYENALSIDREVLGEEHPQTAQDQTLVGLALRRLGRGEEGLTMLRASLASKIRVLGPDDPETARTRFHLADHLRQEGQSAEAETLYREGIASRRLVLGADDIGMVHGMESLALLLSDRGEHGEAETLLRQALEIRRRQLGERSTGVAGSLDQLAQELSRQGRHPEALALAQRGLVLWRDALGPDHAAVGGSLAFQAGLLRDAGRLREAEEMAREALAVRSRSLGPGHVLVGITYTTLCTILHAAGRLDEAAEAGLRALRILESTQPEGHVDRRNAQRALASVYVAMTNIGR